MPHSISLGGDQTVVFDAAISTAYVGSTLLDVSPWNQLYMYVEIVLGTATAVNLKCEWDSLQTGTNSIFQAVRETNTAGSVACDPEYFPIDSDVKRVIPIPNRGRRLKVSAQGVGTAPTSVAVKFLGSVI